MVRSLRLSLNLQRNVLSVVVLMAKPQDLLLSRALKWLDKAYNGESVLLRHTKDNGVKLPKCWSQFGGCDAP